MVAPALRLNDHEVLMLLALGAPCIMVHIIDYVVATSDGTFKKDLMAFELFCGIGGIYATFRRLGLAAAKYDVNLNSQDMDFTSVLGFCVAVQYVLRMRPGSLLWSGLPCSLHIWISRGTHHKSRANPRGVVPGKNMYKCVELANLIACRFGLIALLCLVRQIWWNTEQPGGSVAQWLPYLQVPLHPDRTILGFQSSLIQRFWMGLFGHRSLKRTVCFGNPCWLHMLSLQARITRDDRNKHEWSSNGNTKISRAGDGRIKSVSGGPKLKSTQSYPMSFCARMGYLHKTWCIATNQLPAIPDQHQLEQGPHNFVDPATWEDGKLEEFLCFLKDEIRSGKFKPRKGVPMQVTPLCREQLDVYFALLKGPNLKRKHDQ